MKCNYVKDVEHVSPTYREYAENGTLPEGILALAKQEYPNRDLTYDNLGFKLEYEEYSKLRMQYLEEYQKQVIVELDLLSKKYEDLMCDTRNRACLDQDLFNLYKYSIEPFLGEELGKRVFKESLIQYFGFAYGVTAFKDLFRSH